MLNKIFSKVSKIFDIKFSKRQRYVFTVLTLTAGLVTTQIVPIDQRNEMVVSLGILTFVLSTITQKEDLKGIEYLTLNILPVMFTIAVSYFYFLLPVRWLTRVPTAVLYALGIYAILLTENIYNVAAIRSIQLLRAAHSVGFLTTLITAFLLFDTLISFHSSSFINLVFVLIICFPLILQSLWSMVLEQRISKKIIFSTILSSLIIAETAFMLSFWPINTTIFALFLTTLLYSIIGILQQKLIQRLFPQTLKEFITVVIITFLLIIVTTKWGG
ncbi:MAG: hypothetical protein M1450_01395 [Patescibacteria group bacterium]|nr:hypothetical protein [Patescibacteria group bacterium]